MIAIAIPTYHRIEFTEMCLNSFFKHTDFNLVTKFKVFDNNSGDEMNKLLDSYNIEYEIGNFHNSWAGFNKLYNEIKNDDNFKYIGKIDNDVSFTRPWLQDLMIEFKKDSLIGSISFAINSSKGDVSELNKDSAGGGVRIFNKTIVEPVLDSYRFAPCVSIMNKIKKSGMSAYHKEVGVKMLDALYPNIQAKYFNGVSRRPAQ
tara:strand:- start:1517 stop:2125 length:609 start_codon:yes stop_codon:yes gene_type:complete